MGRAHSRTGIIVQTRARGVHEGITANPAAKNNSREQVMCAEYSSGNLGVTNYKYSARPELLPGGDVREVVTGILNQIQ